MGFVKEFSIWGVCSALLLTINLFWLNLVNRNVPEPYLDEVFHIKQAQVYCSGDLKTWDPKITTPPGLYVASYILHQFGIPCTNTALRQTNVIILSVVLFNAALHLLNRQVLAKFNGKQKRSEDGEYRLFLRNVHTSFNIALFPLLFFFSALYYTDVASTASVLIVAWVRQHQKLKQKLVLRSALLVLTGSVSLFFRQTNVFWVVLFPAALDVVDVVTDESLRLKSPLQAKEVLRQSKLGRAIDLSIDDAFLEDIPLIVLSIMIASTTRLSSILARLSPYFALFAGFASFIVLNGGVVLGDKSNHVATLHLPQMLYIWPLMTFFSLPLVCATFLQSITQLRTSQKSRTKSDTSFLPLLYRSTVTVSILVFSLAAIHFNTIIHPFILADNRHYVFYVFKILLHHPSLRYLAAPIYMLSGWAVLKSFCVPSSLNNALRLTLSDLPATSNEASNALKRDGEEARNPHIAPGHSKQPVQMSYIMIWLSTTTLTLITAPLVEPRYFILPWLFWRLRVQGPPILGILDQRKKQDDMTVILHGDDRLWLETLWYFAINTATGYTFLYRGFEWTQEPGRIQRFMW